MSQLTFNKLSLVLGMVLLCGQSAGAQKTPRSNQEPQPEAMQRERRTDASAVAEGERVGRAEQEKEGREGEEVKTDDPNGRLGFRRLQLQDENGEIPSDGLEKARRHVERMKAAQRERLKARKQGEKDAQPGILAAGIEPDSWEPLGPGNVGGRIRAIVIHPTNPNNMWIGSVSGGIWRTTNAGASWFPVNDFLANLAVSTMVINPVNPSIMYAGTGEGFGNVDAIQGAGVFQSTDGGVTWNQLPSTANNNFFLVNRLAISPNGANLLAATSPVFDAAGNLLSNGGVWRLTDGGATWSRRTNGMAVDVDFLANDSNRAIVGELGSARFSLDGGQTWTAATFTPAIANGGTSGTNGRVEMANARFTSLVYATVNQNNGEVYRSNDGGQSYREPKRDV